MLIKKLKYRLSNLNKIRYIVTHKFWGGNNGTNNEKQEEQPKSYIFHETFKTSTTV